MTMATSAVLAYLYSFVDPACVAAARAASVRGEGRVTTLSLHPANVTPMARYKGRERGVAARVACVSREPLPFRLRAKQG